MSIPLRVFVFCSFFLLLSCGRAYYLKNNSDKPLDFEVNYRACTSRERAVFFKRDLRDSTIANVQSPINDSDCLYRFSLLPAKKLDLYPLLTSNYVAPDKDGNTFIYLIAVNPLTNVGKDTILAKKNVMVTQHKFHEEAKFGHFPFLYFKEFTYTVE